MSIATRFCALGALIVALVMGLAACQTSGTLTAIATDEPDATLTSWLAKPDGDGPFPAVVLLHGCSGTELNTSHRTVWRGLNNHAVLLNDYGYVTLIVDSFGPRSITDGCQTGSKYHPVQISDADAAFDHLASLPFVDAERIGFVGLARDGGTALSLPMPKPYFVEVVHGRTHAVAGNRTAGRDAQTRMLAFFAEHLGGPYPAEASKGVDAAGNSGFGDFLRAAFVLND
ncbi:MAG: alpha/beta hydrolase [Rhodospirillaceae bacterium]|nr:alpha/beta hydrolase [Rhodospirillaceae bacterium]